MDYEREREPISDEQKKKILHDQQYSIIPDGMNKTALFVKT